MILRYNLQFFAKDGPGGERTEPATAKKLRDARKKGQVAKSKEVANGTQTFYSPTASAHVSSCLSRCSLNPGQGRQSWEQTPGAVGIADTLYWQQRGRHLLLSNGRHSNSDNYDSAQGHSVLDSPRLARRSFSGGAYLTGHCARTVL